MQFFRNTRFGVRSRQAFVGLVAALVVLGGVPAVQAAIAAPSLTFGQIDGRLVLVRATNFPEQVQVVIRADIDGGSGTGTINSRWQGRFAFRVRLPEGYKGLLTIKATTGDISVEKSTIVGEAPTPNPSPIAPSGPTTTQPPTTTHPPTTSTTAPTTATTTAPRPSPSSPASPASPARKCSDVGVICLTRGDDFAAKVAGTPAGSTFVIASGVHNSQSVSPRNGDKFYGESGAVMDGGDEPSAFRATADNVTVENLELRNYKDPRDGAVTGRGHRNWVVRYVNSHHNYGAGITMGPGFVVENSKFNDNGALGVGTDGTIGPVDKPEPANTVFRSNEVARNKTRADVDWGWEGGGSKFAVFNGVVVENNWFHHNDGPGIWFDINNVNYKIRSNLVEDNKRPGIFLEIGFAGEIYDNIVRNNGDTGDMNSQIYVSSSTDQHIHHNAITGASPILSHHSDRGDGEYGTPAFGNWDTVRLNVHDNVMSYEDGSPGHRLYGTRVPLNAGHKWDRNTYKTSSGEFFWGRAMNWAEWQSEGRDVNGKFEGSGPATLPAGAKAFQKSQYGPR